MHPRYVPPPTSLHDMTRIATVPLALLTIMALLSACASTPPPRSALDMAGNAIAEARSLGAQDFAPVELSRAKIRLLAAEESFLMRDYADAERSAAQAVLEAQLAQARSRAATLRRQVDQHVEENNRLRLDLLGEGSVR